MIKKLITKLLGKPASGKTDFGKRTEVPASVHGINPKLVDERAVNVVRTSVSYTHLTLPTKRIV